MSDEQETRLSKLLAYLLRHKPDAAGVTLDSEGWVDLDLLIAGVNEHQRLHFTLEPEFVLRVIEGPSADLFQLEGGRVRARSGHSVAGVSIPEPDGIQLPEFLFFGLEPDALEFCTGAQSLTAPPGRPFRLLSDEESVAPENLIVVEALRAARQGVVFVEDEDAYCCERIPLRYVLSARVGYVRQISAGGVLMRGKGAEIEFALIRTLPRPQTSPDEGDVNDERAKPERRADDRRSEAKDEGSPDGVERRRGRSRRMRRRRRSGRWGTEGRLELPKGKLEVGETTHEAAIRETREEMGVSEELSVRAALQKNHYAFRVPDGSVIFKTVHYYMLECAAREPSFAPRLEEGIVSVEWWAASRAIQQVAFPNLRPVLQRAWDLAEGA
ncbi:MAG: NUDIX domain-containing protein [Planctomycetes bacterium]|nr:NUDIX domain-containing protein [Planctomycetota bacterium]